MKKTLKTLICAILLIVMLASMVACDSSDTQKQLGDSQTQLVQQQEQLQQLEKLLKQQQDKNEELELQYSALAEKVQKLQTIVDGLENTTSYEVTAVAKSFSYTWYKPATSYIIYTQEQLQLFLNELEAELCKHEDTWSLKTNDGTIVDKDYFTELSKNFDNTALIVTAFLSPCIGAMVTNHCLWKSADTLHVKIDYTHGDATAVETVLVIMEAERSYIGDITQAELELNRQS